MTGPFGRSAPALWAAGASAIPLKTGQKRPVPRGWSTYSKVLPDAETQRQWLDFFDDGNVGVVMGEASGIVAFDIDTDDPQILAILQQVMPPSPWHRVGKKGKVWLYKWTPKTTTFRVDLEEGGRGFELLATGTQIVVPPSIHPDTGREYYANCDLAELLATRRHELRELPSDIAPMIRAAMGRAGIKLKGNVTGGGKGGGKLLDLVSAGARDTQMVAKAGWLATEVTRGDRNLLEAIGQIRLWVGEYVEKVEGDNIDPDKAIKKLIEFLLRDVTGPRKLTLPSGWDKGLDAAAKTALGLDIIEESSRRWLSSEIQDFIQMELARPDVGGNGRLSNASPKKPWCVSRATLDLTVLEVGRMLLFIHEATGDEGARPPQADGRPVARRDRWDQP